SKVLLEKITQVTRLIRSKGIGIYYVSQNPADIPEEILSQLGNKIQHGLQAYTPGERKKLKAVADSFRENPAFNTLEVLENLGTGEALVSCLDPDGRPTMVEKVMIFPPQTFLGELSPEEKEKAKLGSDLALKYDEMIDRDSAYEMLTRDSAYEMLTRKGLSEEAEKEKAVSEKEEERDKAQTSKLQNRVVKSVSRSVSGSIGREVGASIGKSVFGKGMGRRLGGNIGAALGRGILETLFGR
ncbi:helicase HerA-like domain-containing protein, partial [Oribacterium parvum]